MAPIASLSAQALPLASAQLDAAVSRGDKAEAARLLPILRSLVAIEVAAR